MRIRECDMRRLRHRILESYISIELITTLAARTCHYPGILNVHFAYTSPPICEFIHIVVDRIAHG